MRYRLTFLLLLVTAWRADACVTVSAIPSEYKPVFTGTVEALPRETFEGTHFVYGGKTLYVRLANATTSVAGVTVAIQQHDATLCKATIQLQSQESRTFAVSAKAGPTSQYAIQISGAAKDEKLAVSLAAYAASAPTWVLRLSNSDDYTRVVLNGDEILRCAYRDSCSIDLTARLRRDATNQLVLETINTQEGFTYTWELLANGIKVAGKSCGIANVQPCEGWSSQIGVVYRETYNIPHW